jgi:hypothetical protein
MYLALEGIRERIRMLLMELEIEGLQFLLRNMEDFEILIL